MADAFYTPHYDVADTWVEPVHLLGTKLDDNHAQNGKFAHTPDASSDADVDSTGLGIARAARG